MMISDSFERTILCEAAAIHGARVALAAEFDRLGHAEVIPAAQLAMTELVENVVVHTDCRSCRMVIGSSEDTVRVAIIDAEPDDVARSLPPGDHPAEDDSAAPGSGWLEPGMGLRIVEAMTDGWGCEADLFTKTVWFEFRRPPR